LRDDVPDLVDPVAGLVAGLLILGPVVDDRLARASPLPGTVVAPAASVFITPFSCELELVAYG
jgi:hypothetical protein